MTKPTEATLAPALFYRDPWAAIDFLETAFGFERSLVISDADGGLAHSQLRFGNGYIMVGTEWSADTVSPASAGGKNTQTTHVQVDTDIDAHCDRARASGAVVIQEPENQFYGDRTYRARDPEGHIWTFAQNVTAFSVEESEKATGLKIEVFD
jgi:uncharacterized glyoxalase superfamily protein PhnB